MEEIKKELLESIINEKLEEFELIKKAGNAFTLQDALEGVKQYEKHTKKSKIITKNITSKNPTNLLTL